MDVGKVTENDYKLLATRDWNVLSQNEQSHFRDALHVCATNEMVNAANNLHLEQLDKPIAKILAIQEPNIILKSYEDEANSLPQRLYLSVGCRVMLTRNLWIKGGLVNGAFGTVEAIIYDKEVKPPDPPLYILVKFEKFRRKGFVNNCVPIFPQNAQWTKNNIKYFRRQFPLVLNYATTIHKSQDLTVDRIIINLGPKEFQCGITYVAITRARSLQHINQLICNQYV